MSTIRGFGDAAKNPKQPNLYANIQQYYGSASGIMAYNQQRSLKPDSTTTLQETVDAGRDDWDRYPTVWTDEIWELEHDDSLVNNLVSMTETKETGPTLDVYIRRWLGGIWQIDTDPRIAKKAPSVTEIKRTYEVILASGSVMMPTQLDWYAPDAIYDNILKHVMEQLQSSWLRMIDRTARREMLESMPTVADFSTGEGFTPKEISAMIIAEFGYFNKHKENIWSTFLSTVSASFNALCIRMHIPHPSNQLVAVIPAGPMVDEGLLPTMVSVRDQIVDQKNPIHVLNLNLRIGLSKALRKLAITKSPGHTNLTLNINGQNSILQMYSSLMQDGRQTDPWDITTTLPFYVNIPEGTTRVILPRKSFEPKEYTFDEIFPATGAWANYENKKKIYSLYSTDSQRQGDDFSDFAFHNRTVGKTGKKCGHTFAGSPLVIGSEKAADYIGAVAQDMLMNNVNTAARFAEYVGRFDPRLVESDEMMDNHVSTTKLFDVLGVFDTRHQPLRRVDDCYKFDPSEYNQFKAAAALTGKTYVNVDNLEDYPDKYLYNHKRADLTSFYPESQNDTANAIDLANIVDRGGVAFKRNTSLSSSYWVGPAFDHLKTRTALTRSGEFLGDRFAVSGVVDTDLARKLYERMTGAGYWVSKIKQDARGIIPGMDITKAADRVNYVKAIGETSNGNFRKTVDSLYEPEVVKKMKRIVPVYGKARAAKASIDEAYEIQKQSILTKLDEFSQRMAPYAAAGAYDNALAAADQAADEAENQDRQNLRKVADELRELPAVLERLEELVAMFNDEATAAAMARRLVDGRIPNEERAAHANRLRDINRTDLKFPYIGIFPDDWDNLGVSLWAVGDVQQYHLDSKAIAALESVKKTLRDIVKMSEEVFNERVLPGDFGAGHLQSYHIFDESFLPRVFENKGDTRGAIDEYVLNSTAYMHASANETAEAERLSKQSKGVAFAKICQMITDEWNESDDAKQKFEDPIRNLFLNDFASKFYTTNLYHPFTRVQNDTCGFIEQICEICSTPPVVQRICKSLDAMFKDGSLKNLIEKTGGIGVSDHVRNKIRDSIRSSRGDLSARAFQNEDDWKREFTTRYLQRIVDDETRLRDDADDGEGAPPALPETSLAEIKERASKFLVGNDLNAGFYNLFCLTNTNEAEIHANPNARLDTALVHGNVGVRDTPIRCYANQGFMRLLCEIYADGDTSADGMATAHGVVDAYAEKDASGIPLLTVNNISILLLGAGPNSGGLSQHERAEYLVGKLLLRSKAEIAQRDNLILTPWSLAFLIGRLPPTPGVFKMLQKHRPGTWCGLTMVHFISIRHKPAFYVPQLCLTAIVSELLMRKATADEFKNGEGITGLMRFFMVNKDQIGVQMRFAYILSCTAYGAIVQPNAFYDESERPPNATGFVLIGTIDSGESQIKTPEFENSIGDRKNLTTDAQFRGLCVGRRYFDRINVGEPFDEARSMLPLDSEIYGRFGVYAVNGTGSKDWM
jgi:hypothetical protein